jgi:cytochrome c peroxidase
MKGIIQIVRSRNHAITSMVMMGCLLLFGCNERTSENSPTPALYPEPLPVTVNTPYYFPPVPDTISFTKEGIALGKALFMSRKLSSDGRVSCQSCHDPRAAFSDRAAQSVGVNGLIGTRNSMSLANLLWQPLLFWDGREQNLTALLDAPLTRHDEMNFSRKGVENVITADSALGNRFKKAFPGKEVTYTLAANALTMYVHSLVSASSPYDDFLKGNTEALSESQKRGMQLFFQHPDPRARIRGGNCGDCHAQVTLAGSTFGLQGFHNNGIGAGQFPDKGLAFKTGKPTDEGKFRTPTLRNIALSAPYMHDGRFQTLEQVLDHYNSPDLFDNTGVDTLILNGINTRGQAQLGLTDVEKVDIISFLNALTDTSFTTKN